MRAAARVHGEFAMTTSNQRIWAQSWAALCALGVAAALITLSPRVPAATFTYTSQSCSSFIIAGTPPAQTVTCVSGGGGGAPVCAPTATPAAPLVGSSTTINPNCSNQPTGYVWTGGACAGLTTATCTVTKSRPSTVTYTVSATNGSGTSSATQISVTWR